MVASAEVWDTCNWSGFPGAPPKFIIAWQNKLFISSTTFLHFKQRTTCHSLDTKATQRLAQQLWKWNPFENFGNCEIWTWDHSVDWSGSWTLCLQALAVISGMYVITLKCFDGIARCVAQLHLRPACLQRATWDNVGCWLLEGLFSGWLCLSEPWTRCEYPEEIRPTASDNKTSVPESFVALFSSSSYEVFLLRLFKFAKVQEFSSSSVSAQVLSCKEVALCLQLLTTQHLQTLMSWTMEKLQTWSLDLEKV